MFGFAVLRTDRFAQKDGFWMYIHPSADVEEGTIIGEGTKVWHLCHIRRGARIGAGCILGRGVYVDEGVQIGDRVKIQNYVSVFHGVTIADGVFVGLHVCFTNDPLPRAVNPDMSLKASNDGGVHQAGRQPNHIAWLQ